MLPWGRFCFVFALGFISATSEAHSDLFEVKPRVIYGNDDRLDYFQANSRLQSLADRTALIVDKKELEAKGDQFLIHTEPYGSTLNLCKEEPFFEQETAGFCSAFLIGPDLVATAGHCMEDNACKSSRFVFDFAQHHLNEQPRSVKKDDVYFCKSVVHAQISQSRGDFAIVKLDRSVVGRAPLSLRRSGFVSVGQKLTVIGYPEGLPLKVASGATVRHLGKVDFVADSDTYGGNSGSAIFNDDTGEVEGILVRGENDFETAPGRGCRISKKCAQGGCRGEDVTRIDLLLPFL